MKGEFKYTRREGLPGGANEMKQFAQGKFSIDGYKRFSPDVNNPFNIIPSGDITMKDVDFPVHGVDNLGNSQIMYPGNDYKFPGSTVFETPLHDLDDYEEAELTDEQIAELRAQGIKVEEVDKFPDGGPVNTYKWGDVNEEAFTGAAGLNSKKFDLDVYGSYPLNVRERQHQREQGVRLPGDYEANASYRFNPKFNINAGASYNYGHPSYNVNTRYNTGPFNINAGASFNRGQLASYNLGLGYNKGPFNINAGAAYNYGQPSYNLGLGYNNDKVNFNADVNFQNGNPYYNAGVNFLFQDGGEKKISFEEWYKTVPESKNDTIHYDLRRAYELAPQEELDAFVNSDAHLRSVYKQADGIYEFVKRKDHPTVQKEIEWFNSPDAAEFRENYELDDSGDYYRYIPKQQTGGEEKELPKAQSLGEVKSDLFGPKPSLTPFTGRDLEYERQYVKDNFGNPNREVANKVFAYMKLIEEADAKDAQRKEEAYLKKSVPVSDKTKVETGIIKLPSPQEKIAADQRAKAKKEEQEQFEKEVWQDYSKMSTAEKVFDRAQAFMVDPYGMTARFLTGDQAYIPGMGRGLLNHDNPFYDNYLRAVGYTPGQIEPYDIGHIVNPMYWGTSIGNNIRKGNYGTAALESALTFAPFLPKGTVSIGNVARGTRMLGDDFTRAGKYLTEGPLRNAYKLNSEALKEAPLNTLYHGSNNPNLQFDDIIFTDVNPNVGARPGQFKQRALASGDPLELPGGFYTNDLSTPKFMGNFDYRYSMNIPADAKVFKWTSGISDNISVKKLQELKNKGYDIIEGKNVLGQTEYIPLNKDIISNWKKFEAGAPELEAARNIRFKTETPHWWKGYPKQLSGSSQIEKQFGLSIDELNTKGIVKKLKDVEKNVDLGIGKYDHTNLIEYENGLQLHTYSKPGSKVDDVILVFDPKTNENIAYMRKYLKGDFPPKGGVWEDLPTNEWHIKADMPTVNKDLVKFANKELEKIVQVKPIKYESNTISTDGLRYWNQQQKHGYSAIDDFTTPSVSAAGKDDLFKNLKYSNDDNAFEAVKFATKEDAIEGAARLENLMKNQGLDYKVIINNDNTLKIDLPKLQRAYYKGGPVFQDGGEYIEAKLSLEEINELKEQGYYIEEYQDGGEEKDPDPVTMQEVNITPLSRFYGEYDAQNPYADFFRSKKAKYLSRGDMGLQKWFNINERNFPEAEINRIYDEYQYNRNNYAIEQFAKENNIDLTDRESIMNNPANAKVLSEAMANSKYGKYLQPSLWARTKAGAVSAANALLDGPQGIYGPTFTPDIKGLTPAEEAEYYYPNSTLQKVGNVADVFSFVDAPGAFVMNQLTDNRDYAENPSTLGELASGTLNARTSPMAAALPNLVLAPTGLYNVPDLVSTSIRGLGKVGKYADDAAGLLADGLTRAGDYLTTQTPLRNAWKLNPNAYQYNLPENTMWRGLGKEGMEDALQSGVFRPKNAANTKKEFVSSDGQVFNFGKSFDKTYYSPDFKIADRYGKDFVAEVPNNSAEFTRRYSNKDWSYHTQSQIPVEQGRILQKDWLRGYKPVDVSKQLPGSPNILNNPFIESRNSLSNATSGTSSFLSELLGELTQGSLNRKKIEEGNQWLQEWINHPSTQWKIHNDLNKVRKQYSDFYPKNSSALTGANELADLIEIQSRIFNPNSKEYSLLKQFKDNLDLYTKVLGFNRNKFIKPMHVGNWGVSYQHRFHPERRQEFLDDPTKIPDRYGSYISRTPNMSPEDRVSTTIHEGTHDWISEEAFKLPGGMQDLSLKYTDPEIKKDYFQYRKLRDFGEDPDIVMGKEKAYQAYLAEPTEMHARIMELRHHLGIKPDDVIDDDYVKKVVEYIKSGNSPIDGEGFLRVLGKDNETQAKGLKELFNGFWAAAPITIGVGAGLMDNKKIGGETELTKYQTKGEVKNRKAEWERYEKELSMPKIVAKSKYLQELLAAKQEWEKAQTNKVESSYMPIEARMNKLDPRNNPFIQSSLPDAEYYKPERKVIDRYIPEDVTQGNNAGKYNNPNLYENVIKDNYIPENYNFNQPNNAGKYNNPDLYENAAEEKTQPIEKVQADASNINLQDYTALLNPLNNPILKAALNVDPSYYAPKKVSKYNNPNLYEDPQLHKVSDDSFNWSDLFNIEESMGGKHMSPAQGVLDAMHQYGDLASNYLTRQSLKGNKEAEVKTKSLFELGNEEITDGQESVLTEPLKFSEDFEIKDKHFNPLGRRVYRQEYLDLNNLKFGYRNRGNFNPINTQTGAITSFHPFEKKNNYLKRFKSVSDNATFIGINPNGEFKSGSISDFDSNDFITRTVSNVIDDFLLNNDGTVKLDKRNKSNPNDLVPVVKVIENGKEKLGSLNLLAKDKKDAINEYGPIQGGRVILKGADGSHVFVSGSIQNVYEAFKEMRERTNKPVTIITLDNGAYNMGIRTKDNRLTTQDLQAYDKQHVGGGNFLYLMPNDNQSFYPQNDFDYNKLIPQSEKFKTGGEYFDAELTPEEINWYLSQGYKLDILE